MACKFHVCHNLKKKEDVKMIKAGIIGATGYAGGELVRIAKNAFLLVPNTATVESTVLDEWDEIGKY